MYELVQVSDSCFYVNCPAKIGVVRLNEQEAVLIDSGSDKDAGKKVLRILKEKGWVLCAIYNTHSHADHIGGNRYLQEQTGCHIYVSGIECDFTNHPILESTCLYGGTPLDGLRHKFLLAQESCAESLTQETVPEGMTILPLPGHSFEMVGFRTADDIVYLADCLSAQETLEKYGLAYLTDPEASIGTLETVKTMQARMFVPAHAPAAENVTALAQYNIDAILEAGERITALCAEPILFETLLQKLFECYGMTMNLQQYALIGSTLRSYLSWLERKKQVGFSFENNQMLWQRL